MTSMSGCCRIYSILCLSLGKSNRRCVAFEDSEDVIVVLEIWLEKRQNGEAYPFEERYTVSVSQI